MGSSFTRFQNKGFWTRDHKIEVWLNLLVQEVDALPNPPQWLRQAREHWFIHSTVGMIGCVDADLDTFVTDEERKQTILGLVHNVQERLIQFKEFVGKDTLNAMNVGGAGSSFVKDIATPEFLRIGQALEDLLLGKLQTDASTSPML